MRRHPRVAPFWAALVTGLLTVATIPGTGVPEEYLFTVGYVIILGFSTLVTLISWLRQGTLHPEHGPAPSRSRTP